MTGGNIQRSATNKAYKTIHLPMVTYNLGATTLSQKQLVAIHSVAEANYLPKIGFNRNFPTEVLRGPHKYGGYGDPGLYSRKGYKQLQFLIGNLQSKDSLG